MNKKIRKNLSLLLVSILCAMALSIPAMAAEIGPGVNEDGTPKVVEQTGTSRVITVGASSEDAEQTAEAASDTEQDAAATSESTGETAASTGETAVSTGEAAAPTETVAATGHKGASLGMFTTTGYCNCSRCSGGHNLTYSGTVPKARHTISADLSIFPIGTKLMIDDVIYTVEDMGSSVKGNWIDIFYGSHQEALVHGMRTQEVFRVEE